MTLSEITNKALKFVSDNSPVILTTIGVTGTVTTAILASRASVKATRLIDDREYELETQDLPPMDIKEKIKLTWQFYIPAVSTGMMTIACVVAANRIGSKRAAAMAAAYSLSEKAFTEYKEKVVEKLGEKEETKIRDEINQDRVNRNPVSNNEVIITGQGNVLCYDTITGRYFESNADAIRKAVNEVNFQIIHEMYASLNDFFNKIGLSPTAYSSEVGWNADALLEVHYSTTLSEDDRPCIALEYETHPIRDYARLL